LLKVDDLYSDIATPDRPKALGTVVVVLSHQRLEQQRAEIGAIALVLAILGIGLGGILAIVLARGITRPLLQAANVVARIGSGELGARMSHTGSGPLTPLATGINAMAWRLDAMQDDLRAQVANATAELRQQKEAAESATTAKSRFLAAASHDLRQPLHALGLFVSRLSVASLPRQHRELVGHIEESVNSLQVLLEDLLDLSRLDLKDIVPVMENFNAEDMLRVICQDLSSIAERKRLDFRLRESRKGSQKGSQQVCSDPRLVERVMRNLIGNALTYTDSGTVLVAARRRGSQLRLTVWDTGRGIPAERQMDIFQEYVQIGNEERDRRKGLGLGLSICHHVAVALKTIIGLRSRTGHGSAFWIDIPLSEEVTSQDHVRQVIDSVTLAAPKVLVVGDDSADLKSIAEAIHAWGGEALWALDLAAAVRLCRDLSPPPLMAICDNQHDIPLGGVVVGEGLRREFPAMAILLISVTETSAIKSAARNAGFPLLLRPVQAGRIRAALQQMSGGWGGGAPSRRPQPSSEF
jgi:signal transduction histidine kinase